MGQEIVYCFKCHTRLVGSEFEKGSAFRIVGQPACKPCTKAMAESSIPEERFAAEAAMRPSAPPAEISTASTSSRIPAPRSFPREPQSKTAVLGIAGAFLLGTIFAVFMFSSSNNRHTETVARREPTPEPIVIPSPPPPPPTPLMEPTRPPEPPRPPSEAELKEKKLREERAAAVEAVRELMRVPYLREEFRRSLDLVEQCRNRRTGPEWADEIDGILAEIRVSAEKLYGPLKEKAMDASRRGATGDVKAHVERVAKWGLEDLSADLAKAVAAAAPPPPPPPPPPASPDTRLYASKWETAVMAVGGRDYPAAVASIESALASLKEEAVKAEAAHDAEALRLAHMVPSEVFQLLAKWPADQKIALKVFDETGVPRPVEGTVSRLDMSRLILKRGPSTVTIETGEITPGSLGALFLERRAKKPQTDARAVALFCLVEGDPDAVPKDVPGPPIPVKYQDLARRVAEERVHPGSAEVRARGLFHAAETGYHGYPTRVEAIQKYKELIKEFADTRFVRRNRASIVNRTESGKEYFFFPSQLTAGGTFRSATDPKAETCWTSSADTGKERIKDNFVQLAFSVLPETVYKCWVYAGACCGETFTFYGQVLDAGTESPDSASDDTPQLVKHSLSLSVRTHTAHPGPKQPTRWAWVAVPLPKFTAAGPKKVRVLTNQQGFSVSYALVSSTRVGPPSDTELKKMEKPSGETPLNAGLEAHWKFDEGNGSAASDSSGKGRHGSLVRNPKWVEGKLGGALHFERDNYVLIPHADALAFQAADSFSVSLWANIPSPGGGWRSVFAKSRDIQPHYGLWVSNAGKWFFGGNEKGIEGCAVTTGWHHIVILQNGATRDRSIYVDGVKCGTGPAADANGNGEFRIGAAKSVSEYLTGSVDEVRVYSRALSPAEITQLGQSP